MWYLAKILRAGLTDLPGVVVRDLEKEQCGIVTFTKEGEASSIVSQRLLILSKGINTTVSQANHARLDMGSRELDEVVRASVHYYNTEEEIERFCEVLAHC